jgi:transposase-like protein
MPKVDIITGDARHRTWTLGEKLSILEKAFAPGAVAAHVAHEANIGTGQLYTWRKQLMKKTLGGGNGFVRVVGISDQVVALPPPSAQAPEPPLVASVPPVSSSAFAMPATDLPAIEIEVRGSKVRIPASMPPALATAVLRALVRR